MRFENGRTSGEQVNRQQVTPHGRAFILLCAAVSLAAVMTGLAGPDGRFTSVAHATPSASQQTSIEGTPQWSPEDRGSDNLEVVAHLPLGGRLTVADIDIEQEIDRPYAYVGRVAIFDGERGTDIIDLSDPANASVLYRWRIEDQDLHVGPGGMDVKHFKWNDRYYVVQSLQFGQGGPNADLGAVVLDVTDLPDASSVREGDLSVLPTSREASTTSLCTSTPTDACCCSRRCADRTRTSTTSATWSTAWAGKMVRTRSSLRSRVGSESDSPMRGYHDLYVGYHPDTQQDRFYGGGTGGYYIYDVTDLENPQLQISLVGIEGVEWGHTFTPSPDGRYVVGETEYRYAPLRIFDLKPALDGETSVIRQPISAWTADWRHLVHNHEVRWPYVFVSGYVDGLQIFTLADPQNPATVAWYDTYLGPLNTDFNPVFNGAFGVDVRNEDGLIVVSDSTSGFWAFRMEGFHGWNGAEWGMPDVSSAQKWDVGPGGE